MPISKGVQNFARYSLYALAIVMVPGYLIRHFTESKPAGTTTVGPAASVPMDPTFSAKLDSARKQFQDGLYADALTGYQEAEKSVPRLNESEYQALKEARLQIAHAYESSGDSAAASKAYVTIVSCALREAKDASDNRDWVKALPRAQDAEQFSHQVLDNQRLVIDRSMETVAIAQRGAQNFADAIQEERHLVDYLETSGEQDELLAKAYGNLGITYSDAGQWDNAEQALIRAGEICDLEDNRQRSAEADFDRNSVDYQLLSVYLHAGKTDIGLAKAEEYYNKYRPSDSMPSYRYRSGTFAGLGLALARQAGRQDAINTWERRTHGAS